MTGIVEVAAAVFQRDEDREFLLAQRPEGKVYAGYWEFPGGKVEAGETVREALVRELQEEMGIAIEECSPWLTREFCYPHATVRIHFWRVERWQGEIQPLEHAAVAWLKAGEPPSVAPILPANDPILKALALPTVMAITNMLEHGEDVELARLEDAVNRRGIRLFQVRDKGLPGVERAWFAQAALEMVRHRGAMLIVNDDQGLSRSIGVHGLHLSSSNLRRCWSRPDFAWVGASVHDADELAKAVKLELDYALLGPVLPTASHPDAPTLGWDKFAAIASGSPIPVFALGGMTPELLTTAQRHGAHGIALMRNW